MATRTPTTGLSPRAIMQDAWKLYRLSYVSAFAKRPFFPEGFAWALKKAWENAKEAARIVSMAASDKRARIVQLTAEIRELGYQSFRYSIGGREAALRAELAKLTA